MSLQETKEVFATLIFGSTLASVALVAIAYVIAKISYKKAHKNTHKSVQNRRGQNKTEIVFDIGDTSKMNLFEIKQAKDNIEKSLKGAF